MTGVARDGGSRTRAAVLGLTLVVALAGPARSSVPGIGLAPGWRAEIVAINLPRPLQLAFGADGQLVVLSHGWQGTPPPRSFRLDLDGPLPVDARRAPRVVVPFADERRKTVFGSLALDPSSGALFLGEENGNRIYQLSPDERLTALAVGLYHLVGGSGLALDSQGRLVIIDFASPETQLRSENPPSGALHALAEDGYQGPLVFRLDPRELRALPRRLDLAPPLHPRVWAKAEGHAPGSRFIAVAAGPTLTFLDSLGELVQLGADGRLRVLARLPSGHYHRTSLALTPDGSVLVSTGFHIRRLLRVAPDGTLAVLAWDLGDPNGLAVDARGGIYLAETAHHRVVRLTPAP